MTLPTPTARVTPTGHQLGHGAPTYFTFASNSDLDVWEKSATPAGAKMDGRKDNSSFHNRKWRTQSPGRLATMGDAKVSCGYDPADLQEVIDLLGVRDTVTQTLPTGTTIAYYGWLDEYSFNNHTETDDPMIDLTIAAGNQDWTTCIEAGPVITAGAGTAPLC